jgi:hypothetical protein
VVWVILSDRREKERKKERRERERESERERGREGQSERRECGSQQTVLGHHDHARI